MKNWIVNSLTKLKMVYVGQFLLKPLIKQTQNPKLTQEKLLARILKNHQHTQFGKDHNFVAIRNYQDFKNAVPVCDYEDLRKYIENQESDKSPWLNTSPPVMYAQTSGTTGKPKNIPILQGTVDQYRESQHIVAHGIYKAIPGAYEGKVLAITSPAVEGVLQTGTHYGAMSGLIYQSMPALMQEKYVLPAEVFAIKDYEQKYYEIARRSLSEKGVTMIATANPSTLLKIDRVMNENAESLIAEIETPNPVRARELKQIAKEKGKLQFADIWPKLKAVTTWTGGNCGVLLPELKKMVSPNTRFVELGYLASEFRGGITIDVNRNLQIPTFHENFFEFVDKDRWENDDKEFLTLDQLEQGKLYYIFTTTQNGLYRYNINDLIEVTGRINATPTIQFVQKGKGVISLTGEKLYESQVVEAMTSLINTGNNPVSFFTMLADANEMRYQCVVESEQFDIDQLECRIENLNQEFKDKRGSGRLKSTKLILVKPGTGDAYKKYCLKQGQREGQFKMNYLQKVSECTFPFTDYARKVR